MIKLKKNIKSKEKIWKMELKKNSFIVYMNSDRVKILPQFL